MALPVSSAAVVEAVEARSAAVEGAGTTAADGPGAGVAEVPGYCHRKLPELELALGAAAAVLALGAAAAVLALQGPAALAVLGNRKSEEGALPKENGNAVLCDAAEVDGLGAKAKGLDCVVVETPGALPVENPKEAEDEAPKENADGALRVAADAFGVAEG